MTTRTIAHYEIRELLGEGGIGQVHAAYDTVLGREVAIKSLRPELLNDSSFVERFRTEATNLARLNHPNITTLYTLLPDGGNLYMVMELVRGRTLEQVITERGTPFGSAEAAAIIGQAADGLSYAHAMGVIHRDIKPANLIITETGLLKIMDFGIARVQGSQRHTRDGSVVGTLAYMAPEQLRAEEVDPRTDLYSLAIVLYEMLTGAVPFSATNDYDLMRAQIHTAPERPTKAVPGIDPQIERALMRALAKKPGDRYASVQEFKEALGNPLSRTEAVSIAHKVTRLATAASLQLPPALTTAIAEPARKFSPALRGLAIGAAAAIVVAAAVVLLIGPRPASQTAAVPASAPPVPAAVQQSTAAPKGAPAAPTAAAHPMFPTTRPSQTAASPPGAPPPGGPSTTPARSDGNRPPFPVAAEPSVARSAAQVAEATAPQPAAPVAMAAAVPSSRAAPAAPETRPAPRPAASDSEPPAAVPVPEKMAAATPPETPGAAAASDQPGASIVTAQAPAQPTEANEERSPQSADGAAQSATQAAATAGPAAAVPAAPSAPAAPPAPGAPATPSAAPATTAAALPATAPAAARVTFADIKAAYDMKDYPRTRELAEPLASGGDPDAQFIMGRRHHIGGAMRTDEEKAVQWYQKAAEQGHPTAQYALGLMYENGDGVLADKRAAAEWYRKAATRGVAAAQFNLGVLFARGEGVDKDTAQARRWLTEAANSNNPKIAEQAEAALEQLPGRRRRR